MRRESQALRQSCTEAITRAQASRDQFLRSRQRLLILRDSPFARLLARQETMPLIEQAKGIIMAQQQCGPEEAFDLLRRASQRANIKIRVLAAQIVGNIDASSQDGNVPPLKRPGSAALLGAAWHAPAGRLTAEPGADPGPAAPGSARSRWPRRRFTLPDAPALAFWP